MQDDFVNSGEINIMISAKSLDALRRYSDAKGEHAHAIHTVIMLFRFL